MDRDHLRLINARAAAFCFLPEKIRAEMKRRNDDIHKNLAAGFAGLNASLEATTDELKKFSIAIGQFEKKKRKAKSKRPKQWQPKFYSKS